MASSFKWNGDKIVKKIIAASKGAIDETTAACVNDAKPNTPVITGTLQGSIRLTPAVERKRVVTGTVGELRRQLRHLCRGWNRVGG